MALSTTLPEMVHLLSALAMAATHTRHIMQINLFMSFSPFCFKSYYFIFPLDRFPPKKFNSLPSRSGKYCVRSSPITLIIPITPPPVNLPIRKICIPCLSAEDAYFPFRFVFLKLRQLSARADSTRRAGVGTCAAVNAYIGVDAVDVALRDCTCGALVNASTASNAVITNYISHFR